MTVEFPEFYLAPMAGLSTPALRALVARFGGCDWYYSEMISAPALLAGGRFESYYLDPTPDPARMIHQLVGSRVEDLAGAAALLDEIPGSGIDLNMGCAAPELVRSGAGVAWMRDLEAARRLVAAVRRRVRRKLLSCKIRLGYREDGDALVRFAGALAEEGCERLVLHPRTAGEKFKRRSRWSHVALLRDALRIPVIGNGDIATAADYQSRVAEAAPSGVMVGRAAVKEPWIFAHLDARRRGAADATRVDLAEVASAFLDLLPEYQPPEFLQSRARRFFAYYTANLPFGHHLNARVQTAGGFPEIARVVTRYFAENPQTRGSGLTALHGGVGVV